MCPHAISLAAAVGVASAIIKHMVAVDRPISGKASASKKILSKPVAVEPGCKSVAF
jgi:hypothetical protein